MAVDSRSLEAYLDGHVPGAVSAPFASGSWAMALRREKAYWLRPVVLIADNDEVASLAEQALQSVGIAIAGVWSDGVERWRQAGFWLAAVPQLSVDELYAQVDQWTVLDVREPVEWASGIIAKALKIPLSQFISEAQRLTDSHRYAVVCAHGHRSLNVAVYLADRKFRVANVAGGVESWKRRGYPVNFA